MTEQNQKQLGKTRWAIADQLRGAMDADDFRDYKNGHIDTVIDLPSNQFRVEEDRYSRRVEMAEIEKNDFNLNISRYISTAVGEAEIDLAETNRELVEIEKAIATAKQKHNSFLEELGLSPLP